MGRESSGDLSAKWVERNEKVKTIEKAIPLNEFTKQCELRELSQEFKLIKKITETKYHMDQMVEGRKMFNRYSDFSPFQHTCVSLPQREDKSPSDSYINANYIKSASGRKLFIATQGPLPST